MVLAHMYTKMKKRDFLDAVEHEVKMLRKHGFKKELERLDFDSLDPHSRYFCIYGQMTEDCKSPRAVRLVNKCCEKVVYYDYGGYNYSNFKNCIEDNKSSIKIDKHGRRNLWEYMSALETYIESKGAKNKQIISYLKGETNTIKL